MVPRHPEDLSKALGRLGEGYAAMLGRLSNISTQDKVIVGVRQQPLESLAVGLEGEMYVANGP